MSVEKVKEYLKKFNIEDEILTFEGSSKTVSDAALELGCEEARIAKSLSFRLKDKCIVVVVRGDARIDNSKYKQEFGEKAHMLAFEEVEEVTGHPVGGVCPFGLNDGVDVYLDVSLKDFDYVYPACGEINNAIKITVDKLEKVCNPVKWVDICK